MLFALLLHNLFVERRHDQLGGARKHHHGGRAASGEQPALAGNLLVFQQALPEFASLESGHRDVHTGHSQNPQTQYGEIYLIVYIYFLPHFYICLFILTSLLFICYFIRFFEHSSKVFEDVLTLYSQL